MGNALLLVFILTLGTSLAVDWTQHSYATSVLLNRKGRDIVKLSVSPSSGCLYETLHVWWNSTTQTDLNDVLISVAQKGATGFLTTPLTSTSTWTASNSPSADLHGSGNDESRIKCLINEFHCSPSVDYVKTSPERSRLIIAFKEATNEPDLLSTRAVNQSLSITPPLTGAAIGDWKSPTLLEILVDVEYLDMLFRRHQAGELIEIAARPQRTKVAGNNFRSISSNEHKRYPQHSNVYSTAGDINLSGYLKLLPREHGTLQIFAVQTGLAATDQSPRKERIFVVSEIAEVDVSLCDDAVAVLPSLQFPSPTTDVFDKESAIQSVHVSFDGEARRDIDNSAVDAIVVKANRNVAVPAALPRIEEIHRIVEAQPVIRVDGVLPITGTEPLKLGNASVVPMAQGKSWSLSMWLNLLEGPTGTHRALFHKGPPKGTTDGSLAHRTPSAWLLPDSNRLALRVSTNITNDIGADTRKEIPLGRWTLLTFVFENLTLPFTPPRPSHPSSDPLHSSSPLHPLSDDVDLIQQSRRGIDTSSDGETTEQPGQSSNPSAQQEKAGGRSSRSEDSGGVVDQQRRSNFRLAVYLNGEVDTELNFLQDVVIRNEHPLQLFRDVSHSGPKSLITDLILWDAALSHERIRSLYLARAGQALPFSPPLSTSVGAVTSKGSLPTSVEDPAIQPRTTTAAAEGMLHDQSRREMKNTFAIDSTDAAMALLSTSARALFKQLNWSPTPLKSKLDVGSGLVFVYQPLYSSSSFPDMNVGFSAPVGGSGSDAIGRGIRETEEEEDEEEHGGHGHEHGNGQDSDSSSSTTKAAVQALLQEAAASALSCGAFSRRLDIYAEAASLYGSAEALYHWGMLMSLGSEHASVQCGVDGDVLGSNYNEPTENSPTSTPTSTSISKRLSSSPALSLSPPATEQSSKASEVSALQQLAGAESAEEIDRSGMEGSYGDWEGRGEENGSESEGISDESLSDIASGRQRGEPSGRKEQGALSASKQQSLQPPAATRGGGEGGGGPSFRTEHQRIDDYVRNQHQQQQRALYAFLVAADMGYAPALLPIALAVLSGIGIETLLQHDLKILAHTGVRNPPPPAAGGAAGTGRKGASSEQLPRRLWYVPVPEEYIVIRPASVRDTAGLGNVAGRSYYRRTALQRRLGEYLVRATEDCHRSIHQRNYRERRRYEEPLPGYSVLCPAHSAAVYQEERREGKRRREEEERDPTLIAVGLLHVASLFGDQEANAALSYRYEHGLGGVARSTETAAQFALRAVAAAQEAFYKVGGQPVMDDARINDHTVRELPKGNQGEDDELIQNQIIRAKEGHLPSILAMADLYYFGARGLPRDQPLALRYFEQAAALGDSMGLCGAAAMYLKGEGLHNNNNNNSSSVENAESLDRNAPSELNVTHAVILYEKAASMGSIKALNGLGFIYFHGHHAPAYPQNHTKAYEYFLTAAEVGTDGDSLFNTGFCVENGLGTRADFVRARAFFEQAAKKFGHFGSVTALGDMYMEGRGVERSPSIALQYLKPAKSIGPWAGWLRRGLDQYLLSLSVPQLMMTSRAANIFGIRGDGKGSVLGMFGGIVDDFNDYFGSDSSISSSLSHIASAGAGLLSSALSSVIRSTASSSSATDPATTPNIGDSPSEAEVLSLSVAELSRRGRRHVSHMRSLSCYVRAGELGYEISQSNAAYILRSKLNTGMLPTQRTSDPTAPTATLESYAGASLVEYSVGRRTPTTSNLPPHSHKSHTSHTSHSTAISPTLSSTVPLPVTWSDSEVENESPSEEEVSKERIPHTSSHTSTSSASPPSAAASTPAAVVSPDAVLWLERLYFRESLLSAYHGNKDSVLEIGHCYFKNSCGLHESEFDTKQRQPETSASTPRYSVTVGPSAVVWWYSKASHLGNAMASVYLGVMYHFGVGGVQPLSLPQQSPGTPLVAPSPTLSPGTGATAAAADGSSGSGIGDRAGGFEIEVERVNYVRAARYYEDAMKPGSDLDSQPQLRATVQALQYMLRHLQGSSSSSDGNNKGYAIWGGGSGGRGGGDSFGLFSSMHVGVDYVVCRLWGEP